MTDFGLNSTFVSPTTPGYGNTYAIQSPYPITTNTPVAPLSQRLGTPNNTVMSSGGFTPVTSPMMGTMFATPTNGSMMTPNGMVSPTNGGVATGNDYQITQVTSPITSMTRPATNYPTTGNGSFNSPQIVTPLTARVVLPQTVVPNNTISSVAPYRQTTPRSPSSPAIREVMRATTPNTVRTSTPTTVVTSPVKSQNTSRVSTGTTTSIISPAKSPMTVNELSYHDVDRNAVKELLRKCPENTLCLIALHGIDRKDDSQRRTVGDIIRQSPKYSTLKGLLEQAGLLDELDKDVVITLFAPTNEAFVRAKDQGYLKDMTPEKLKSILKGHIIRGRWKDEYLRHLTPSTTIKSLGALPPSGTIKSLDGPAYHMIQNGDSHIYRGATSAKVTTPDIPASNGIVHEVDEVIL